MVEWSDFQWCGDIVNEKSAFVALPENAFPVRTRTLTFKHMKSAIGSSKVFRFAKSTKSNLRLAKKKGRGVGMAFGPHKLERKSTLPAKTGSAMSENLVKASHSAGFLIDELREALKDAGGVEALVILERIQEANVLKGHIDVLRAAVDEESETDASSR